MFSQYILWFVIVISPEIFSKNNHKLIQNGRGVSAKYRFIVTDLNERGQSLKETENVFTFAKSLRQFSMFCAFVCN